MFTIILATTLLIAGGTSANSVPHQFSAESFLPPGFDRSNNEGVNSLQSMINIIIILLGSDPYVDPEMNFDVQILNIDICITVKGFKLYGMVDLDIRAFNILSDQIYFDLYIPVIRLSFDYFEISLNSPIGLSVTLYGYGSTVFTEVCLSGTIYFNITDDVKVNDIIINVSANESQGDLTVRWGILNLSNTANQIINNITSALDLLNQLINILLRYILVC
ncbi:hypothetical protein K1T71_003504 [Dendrolimus kikuchii]|uniref:Uncharacterized protein n=1 Tax=Dendrolimus kikuchii TaxID=765133 RepID=A0ACC1DCF0_9NEOP|nr:hypothetical protein K1T71_003504 [Dendrolimus kikuchii]